AARGRGHPPRLEPQPAEHRPLGRPPVGVRPAGAGCLLLLHAAAGRRRAARQSRMNGQPTAYVVDDEESIRSLWEWLMSSNGIAVQTFASAAAFIQAYRRGD